MNTTNKLDILSSFNNTTDTNNTDNKINSIDNKTNNTSEAKQPTKENLSVLNNLSSLHETSGNIAHDKTFKADYYKGFVTKEYANKYNLNPYSYTKWEKDLYNKQSGWEVAKNTAAQFVGNLASGVFTNIGGDIGLATNGINLIKGESDLSRNFAEKISDDIVANMQEKFPIFSNPDDDRWYSPTQLAQQIASSGQVVGIAAKGLAEQAALGAITTYTLGSSAPVTGTLMVAEGARTLNKIRKVLSASKKIIKSRAFRTAFVGTFKGASEAYSNAHLGGIEHYENLLDKVERGEINLTQEEIEKAVQKEVRSNFLRQVAPSITFGIISQAFMARSFKKGDAFKLANNERNFNLFVGIDDLVSAPLNRINNKIGNKYLKGVTGFATEVLSQGTEEFTQDAITSYTTYETDKKLGIRSDYDSYTDAIFNKNNRDSFIGGVIGGAIMGGIHRIGGGIHGMYHKRNLIRNFNDYQQSLSTALNSVTNARIAVENEIEVVNNKIQNETDDQNKSNLIEKRKKLILHKKELDSNFQLLQLNGEFNSIKEALVQDLRSGNNINSDIIKERIGRIISDIESYENADEKDKSKLLKRIVKSSGFDIKSEQLPQYKSLVKSLSERVDEYIDVYKQAYENFDNDIDDADQYVYFYFTRNYIANNLFDDINVSLNTKFNRLFGDQGISIQDRFYKLFLQENIKNIKKQNKTENNELISYMEQEFDKLENVDISDVSFLDSISEQDMNDLVSEYHDKVNTHLNLIKIDKLLNSFYNNNDPNGYIQRKNLLFKYKSDNITRDLLEIRKLISKEGGLFKNYNKINTVLNQYINSIQKEKRKLRQIISNNNLSKQELEDANKLMKLYEKQYHKLQRKLKSIKTKYDGVVKDNSVKDLLFYFPNLSINQVKISHTDPNTNNIVYDITYSINDESDLTRTGKFILNKTDSGVILKPVNDEDNTLAERIMRGAKEIVTTTKVKTSTTTTEVLSDGKKIKRKETVTSKIVVKNKQNLIDELYKQKDIIGITDDIINKVLEEFDSVLSLIDNSGIPTKPINIQFKIQDKSYTLSIVLKGKKVNNNYNVIIDNANILLNESDSDATRTEEYNSIIEDSTYVARSLFEFDELFNQTEQPEVRSIPEVESDVRNNDSEILFGDPDTDVESALNEIDTVLRLEEEISVDESVEDISFDDIGSPYGDSGFDLFGYKPLDEDDITVLENDLVEYLDIIFRNKYATTFEEYINDVANIKGTQEAMNIFARVYKAYTTLFPNSKEDFNAIRKNLYFRSIQELSASNIEIENTNAESTITETEVETESTDINTETENAGIETDKIKKGELKRSKIVQVDANENTRVVDTNCTADYKSIEFEVVHTEDGYILKSIEGSELTEQGRKLSNPFETFDGNNFYIVEPENSSSIPIIIYKEDPNDKDLVITYKGTIDDLINERVISENERYKYVPLVVTDGNTVLFTIRNESFYNKQTFGDPSWLEEEYTNKINTAKENINKIRNKYREFTTGESFSYPIITISKENGHIINLSQSQRVTDFISDTSNLDIFVATGESKLTNSKDKVYFRNGGKDGFYGTTNPFIPGLSYIIIDSPNLNPLTNKPYKTPVPLVKPILSETDELLPLLTELIRLKSLSSRKFSQEIKKQVSDRELKIYLTQKGLKELLGNFVMIYSKSNYEKLKVPVGKAVIYADGNKLKIAYRQDETTLITEDLKSLNKNVIDYLGKVELDFRLSVGKENMISINEGGNFVYSDQSIQQFVLSKMKTNRRIFNVGTETNPIYTIYIHPKITYDLAKEGYKTSSGITKILQSNLTTISKSIESRQDLGTIIETEIESTDANTDININTSTDNTNIKIESINTETTVEIENTNIEIEDTNTTVEVETEIKVETETVQLPSYSTYDILSPVQEFKLLTSGTYGDGIKSHEINELRKSCIGYIFENIRINDIKDVSQIKGHLRKYIQEALNPVLKETKNKIEKLKSDIEKAKSNGKQTSLLEKQLRETEIRYSDLKKLTEKTRARKVFEKELLLLLSNFYKIETEVFEVTEEDASTQYSKSSFEERNKSSLTTQLKILFSTIKTGNKNSFGLDEYYSFDQIYNIVENVFINNKNITTDPKTFIEALEEIDRPELESIIKILKDDLYNDAYGKTIINAFTTNFNKQRLSFIGVRSNRDNENKKRKRSLTTVEITNNTVRRGIVNLWKSKFQSSPLVIQNESGISNLNTDVINKVLEEAEKYHTTESEEEKKNIVRYVFDSFGITLNDKTIDELINLYPTTLFYKKKNDATPNTKAIGGLLLQQLKSYNELVNKLTSDSNITNEQRSIIDKSINTHIKTVVRELFENSKPIIELADIEQKHSDVISENVTRIKGKTIYLFSAHTYSSMQSRKLTSSVEYRESLKANLFSKHSILLSSPIPTDVWNRLELKQLSLDPFMSKRTKNTKDITELSDSDQVNVSFGLFQSTIKETLQQDLLYGFNTRLYYQEFPTISDKGTVLVQPMLGVMFKTSDLFDNNGNVRFINENGTFTNAFRLIFDKLVLPELERIIARISKDEVGKDISGYEFSSKYFNQYDFLNVIINPKFGKSWLNIIHTDKSLNLQNKSASEGLELLLKICADFDSKSNNDFIYSVAKAFEKYYNEKLQFYLDNYTTKDKSGKTLQVSFNNTYQESLDKRVDVVFYENKDNTAVKLYILEFIINQELGRSELSMLYNGDPALYGKHNAKDRSDFETRTDIDYFRNLNRKTRENYSKRMASESAPGQVLSRTNELSSHFTEVFLQDPNIIANNIVSLIKIFYPSVTEQELNELQNAYNKHIGKENDYNGVDIKTLVKEKYPIVSSYLNIEITDGQELTTIKEHLGILFAQGKITSQEYKEFTNLTELQNKDIEKYGYIKSEHLLTNKQIQKMLQPLKPVITSMISHNGVNRKIYIKTSSFPLIPQVTVNNSNSETIRKALNIVEENAGTSVRLTFSSGIKVGNNAKVLNIFDDNGNINEMFSDPKVLANELLTSASVSIPRSDLKIQLSVPVKDKNEISQSTQMLRVIFSDGMVNQKGFKFYNRETGQTEEKTGKELLDMFTQTHKEMIDLRVDELINKFNLTFFSNKAEHSAYKLQFLNNIVSELRKEFIKRGIATNNLDEIKIVKKKENGKETYDLSLPLWLISESSKIESIINSIITKQLVSIKVPGNSYILGSLILTVNENQSVQSVLTNADINHSRIIYTDNWSGTLYGLRYNDKESKILPAQALIPHKFVYRDKNGNNVSVELYNSDGSINEKYSVKTDNGWRLLTTTSQILKQAYEKIESLSEEEIKNIKNEDGIPTDELELVIYNILQGKNYITEDVMRQVSFRIPYSAHLSTSAIEVVGILPPEVGDQVIVPASLMVQKGFDFDVDKENFYVKTLSQDEHGNIVVNENDDSTIKHKEDLLHNKLLDIYNSIISNPDPYVQQRVNTALSTDSIKDSVNTIVNALNNSTQYQTHSFYDYHENASARQRGSVGQVAVGAYSNTITLLSQMQTHKEGVFRIIDSKGRNNGIRIGGLTSTGILNRIYTLTNDRSLINVFMERQNAATDNAKLNYLGNAGITKNTLGIDIILNLLGFNMVTLSNGRRVEVSHLLLNQPIIKDYIKSNEFAQRKPFAYITKRYKSLLQNKFGVDFNGLLKTINNNKLNFDYSFDQLYDVLQGKTLESELSEDNEKNTYIREIRTILLISNLNDWYNKISNVQAALSIFSTGVGKSFSESLERSILLENILATENSNSKESYATGITNTHLLIRDGKNYTTIGNILFKSTYLSNKILDEFFIHNNTLVRNIVDIIMSTNNTHRFWKETAANKELIIREFKRFLFSSRNCGIYNYLDSMQDVRKKLLLDTADNTSLARYLRDEMYNSDPDKKEIVKYLRSNPLLKLFRFEINKVDGSFIFYDSTSHDNTDESDLYNAILKLIDDNITLTSKDGKRYTSKDLAYDLIHYAYATSNGIQSPGTFVRYVPLKYLELVEFDDYANGVLYNNSNTVNKALIDRFVKQFFAHNPDFITTSLDDKKGFKIINTDESTGIISVNCTLNEKDLSSKAFKIKKDYYIVESIDIAGDGLYNIKLRKLVLFNNSAVKEYDFENDLVTPLFDKQFINAAENKKALAKLKAQKNKPKTVLQQKPTASVNEQLESLKRIIDTTKVKNLTEFSTELSHIESLLKLVLTFDSNKEFNTLQKIKFVTNEELVKIGGKNYNNVPGTYDKNTDTIYINKDAIKNNNLSHEEQILLYYNVLLHEIVHAKTVNHIGKYVTTRYKNYKLNIKHKNEVTPDYIKELVSCYELTIAELKKLKSLKKFSYELNNIEEFVSAVMSNKEFREVLSKISIADNQTTKSIYEKIRSIILKMFSINTAKDLGLSNTTLLGKSMGAVLDLLYSNDDNNNDTSTDTNTSANNNNTSSISIIDSKRAIDIKSDIHTQQELLQGVDVVLGNNSNTQLNITTSIQINGEYISVSDNDGLFGFKVSINDVTC